MKDTLGSPALKTKLSENTLNKATSGFKRFNILQNNNDDGSANRRKSIIMDNEYESSELNVSNTESESSEKEVVEPPRELEEVEEVGKDKHVVTPKGLVETHDKRGRLVYKHVKTSKVRYKKDGQMRSNFGDLIFLPRYTIFDQEIYFGAKFFGFFVAIWLCVFFFGLNVILSYHTSQGTFKNSEIVHLMLKDLWKVALFDLTMYLSMYFSVFVQLCIKSQLIRWKPTGFTLQAIYEVLLLVCPFFYADKLQLPWIAQIFLMLHSVVMLMKVHSYAFFNGYLWEIKNEYEFSTLFMKKKDILEENIVSSLEKSIKFCQDEIKSQSFPNNISFKNFFIYSMFPVLVYQSEYPRNDRIRAKYLFNKILGIFGVIFLMMVISQHNLYPIVIECLRLQKTTSIWYRIKVYPLILIRIIPSFLSVYLLTFYLIWELILNALAEITRFADREFYGYWWNSVNWNEYARDWNVPVHKFLLRHVYHSSISAFKVNKTVATFMTFFLSSIIHELAMYVIFKKVRFYLLLLQMSQLCLIQITNTKYLRNMNVFNNAIFWFGIIFGPSLMCTMYLVF
ncbi:hypothetical protein CAS74_001429 [Pichia kudriavzevii]|uniref:O-acyltransferase n=1 Tax=Pichia kudriavzevii TaxID=4909 RepID=A0A1Z8JRA5_PICKU|nr:hypothetical protein CAS74_001429 [Pichia kudriavzevii]